MRVPSTTCSGFGFRQVPVLLRGEGERISRFMAQLTWQSLAIHLTVIVLGTGLFGAAVGAWRAPLQALYTALKFPSIVLLTTGGNALLNALLAPLLGVNLRFRQSMQAVLMSFTMAACILGAFSPLMLFFVWNTPLPLPGVQADIAAYHSLLLAQVAAIAFAGVAANFRLWQWLRWTSGNPAGAARVLAAWLAGNLLLGSQLSHILRPFVGNPQRPIQFLRPDAFHGNFFESVLHAATQLLLP